MTQANPLNAMGQMFGTLQGFSEQRARNQAGRAYAGGDARGAANALASGGLSQEAAELEYAQTRREALLNEQERAQAEQRVTFLRRGVSALQAVPYEQRNQAFDQLAPQLEPLVGPEVMAQLRAADKSDAALAAFGAAIGQEAQRLQLFQTRQGDIVGVNPQTGEQRMVYDGPEQTPDAPNGYRWTADGSLEAIPGGPADPRVAGGLAASRRAPSRGSSGGGSRRSGGGSSPVAPAAPSGGSSLPPGFTVRRR